MGTDKKKILIADESSELLLAITKAKKSDQYQFEIATNGYTCLEKVHQFQPHLLIIDLMLPKIHGIEVLRQIKQHSATKNIGVILLSALPLIQNYHSAIQDGADYFLDKPFEMGVLYELIEKFFAGTLTPAPFVPLEKEPKPGEHCYFPQFHPPDSYLKFWGTRGSNAVSGPEYIRFGGNTPCLEVRKGDDLIIIDAGTGIRLLGNSFKEMPKTIHLIFSHTHWDHIMGFPFFAPIYDAECEVVIWTPIGFEKSARELFTEMLAYSYFPVRLDDIKAKLTFKEIREGQPLTFGQVELNTHYAYHPGATLCFKIQADNHTIGYATDNEFLMGYHGNPNTLSKEDPILKAYSSQIEFFKGCDVLIHEAQYTPIEYQEKVGWGHSSISNATALVKYTDPKEWIITHHDPKHTDEELLKKLQMHHDILKECELDTHCRFAFDGFVYPLS